MFYQSSIIHPSKSDYNNIISLCHYHYFCDLNFTILKELEGLFKLLSYHYNYCPWCGPLKILFLFLSGCLFEKGLCLNYEVCLNGESHTCSLCRSHASRCLIKHLVFIFIWIQQLCVCVHLTLLLCHNKYRLSRTLSTHQHPHKCCV